MRAGTSLAIRLTIKYLRVFISTFDTAVASAFSDPLTNCASKNKGQGTAHVSKQIHEENAGHRRG